MKKKKILTTLMLSLMFISPVTAYATPATSGETLQSLEQKIQILDNEISTETANLKEMKDSIKAKETNLTDKYNELTNTVTEHNAVKQKSESQKAITTNIHFINMLLGSESISDLLKNIEMANKIKKESNTNLKNLGKQEDIIYQKQVALQLEIETLKTDIIDVETKTKELESEKEEAQTEINELQAQIAEVAAREASQSSNGTSTGGGQATGGSTNVTAPSVNSASAQAVLNEAYKYLGVPYVWGGTTPSGFDCSGLTQYVYRKAGVSLPRIASAQQNFGTQVSTSALQPGDLVFFGRPAYHVGIYVGNGQYLHAPRTGDVVKVSSLKWNPATSVTRVL